MAPRLDDRISLQQVDHGTSQFQTLQALKSTDQSRLHSNKLRKTTKHFHWAVVGSHLGVFLDMTKNLIISTNGPRLAYETKKPRTESSNSRGFPTSNLAMAKRQPISQENGADKRRRENLGSWNIEEK